MDKPSIRAYLFKKTIMAGKLNILQERVFSNDKYTISHIYAVKDGVKSKICDAIEDPDRGLNSNMTVEEINRKKVYGETAIPAGTYKVRMDIQSPKYSNFTKYPWAKKYNGRLPRFMDVKGFSGVLVHVGNQASDSYGCVLTGLNKVKGKVVDSKVCFEKIMDQYLVPAYQKGWEIEWKIVSPGK